MRHGARLDVRSKHWQRNHRQRRSPLLVIGRGHGHQRRVELVGAGQATDVRIGRRLAAYCGIVSASIDIQALESNARAGVHGVQGSRGQKDRLDGIIRCS